MFLYCRNDGADDTVSVPLRGVGCFRQGAASATGYQGFPSPCGVWVVSSTDTTRTQTTRVSVPLRGVGCFRVRRKAWTSKRFPSPCGVWVVSKLSQMSRKHKRFRPLAGCGLFPGDDGRGAGGLGFRPLAGCGLFQGPQGRAQGILQKFPSPCGVWVVSADMKNGPTIGGFRPLAGCGLFQPFVSKIMSAGRFRPLAGCGLFLHGLKLSAMQKSFRPLAGCGLFPDGYRLLRR